MVPAAAATLDSLRRELAPVGPVWPCLGAQDLAALVRDRRIRLVVSAPRDPQGELMADALSAVADTGAAVKIALLAATSPPELLDLRRIVVAGGCDAVVLQPAHDLAGALRTVLSPRWQRGAERMLLRGLLPPLRGTAQPFAVLSLLQARANLRIRDMCEASGLPERRVERDFARSLPRTATERHMTPHRFARISLSLHIAWWLARGRTVDELVVQFGFVHRYALAEHLRKYAKRSPGSITRPRHFRAVYADILRRFYRSSAP